MSLTSGSLTLSRYRAQCPYKSTTEIAKALSCDLVQDLDLNTSSELSFGWCDGANFTSDLDSSHLNVDGKVLFGFRIDRKRVPASAIRLSLKAMMEPGVKLKRKERQALLDRIKSDLLRKTPPTSICIQILWDIDKDLLWIDNAGQANLDLFIELYTKTFGGPLIPMKAGIAVLPWSSINQEVLNPWLDVCPVAFGRGVEP